MYRSTRAPRGFTAREATSSRECIMNHCLKLNASFNNWVFNFRNVVNLYANSFFHFSSIFFFNSALSAFTGGKRSRQA